MRATLILLILTVSAHAQFGLRSPGYVSRLNQTNRQPFDGAVSTNALATYWRMDEVSTGAGAVSRLPSWGTTILGDTSGFCPSTNGISTNAVLVINADAELLFVGDNAEISMPNTSFTITLWCRMLTTGTRPIITKSTSTAMQDNEYNVSFTSTTLIFRVGDGTNSATATITNAFAANATYFIAARCDLATDLLTLSVNGGAFLDTETWVWGTRDSTSSLNVGRNVAAATQRFDGWIDEVAIWKRALTDAEIAALATGKTL